MVALTGCREQVGGTAPSPLGFQGAAGIQLQTLFMVSPVQQRVLCLVSVCELAVL